MSRVMEDFVELPEGLGRRVRIVTRRGDFARAELMDEVPCEACDGTGHQLIERGDAVFVAPCACARVKDSCAKYNSARIPRRLASKTFENFEPNEALAMALGRVKSFVETHGTDDGSLGFVLMGPVGTGKSHLLAATLRVLSLERRIDCRYVEFFHLLSELKDGYSSGKSEMEIIAPLCAVDVLAVDELGKGRGSDWEMYVLDEIISRRYNADKVTLFASNYTSDPSTSLRARLPAAGGAHVRTRGREFAHEAVVETLEDRVGQRIFSRLSEMCDMIPCQGPDYRRAAPRS